VAGEQSSILILPIKAFHQAKGRLAQALTASQRARLARECAERVVSAAEKMAIIVVTDDSPNNDVPAWVAALHEAGCNIECLIQRSLGLNGAVRDGVAVAKSRNFTSVVIAHSDVPLATDVTEFISPNSICIVPDRHDSGTNLMVLPTAIEFNFHYGEGSFTAHVDEAIACGFSPRIAINPNWALDLDEPHDLFDPRVKEAMPWLLTSPDNH